MIRVIGIQRVILLVVLAIFAAAALIYNYYFLSPNNDMAGRELRMNQSEISKITKNMDDLSQGLQKFSEQKKAFQEITNFGFFNPQNRVEANQRFTAMQKYSNLIGVRYDIKPAILEENQQVEEAGHKIVKTEISLTLDAIDDGDIYEFLHLLNYGFPGHVAINSMVMTRELEVSQPLLRKIGLGEPETLVQAQIELSWRTMVSRDFDVTVSEPRGRR